MDETTEIGPCPVNMLIPRQYDALAMSQAKIASALVSEAGLTTISQLVDIQSSTSNVSTTLSACFDPLPPLPNLRVFVVDPIPGPKVDTTAGPVPIVAIDQSQATALIEAINDIDVGSHDYTAVLTTINAAVTSTSSTVGTTTGPAIVQIQQTMRNAIVSTATSPPPTLQDAAAKLNAAVCSVATLAPPAVQDQLTALQTTASQLNASVCSTASTMPATVQDQLAAIAVLLAAMPTYAQIKALVNDFSFQTLYALIGGSRVVASGFLGNSSSTNAGSLATAITGDNSSSNFSVAAAGPLGPQVTTNATTNAGNVVIGVTINAENNAADIIAALAPIATDAASTAGNTASIVDNTITGVSGTTYTVAESAYNTSTYLTNPFTGLSVGQCVATYGTSDQTSLATYVPT